MFTDVDCQRLNYTRLSESSYDDNVATNYQIVHLRGVNHPSLLHRFIDSHPFVSKDLEQRNERCEEIFAIQSAGLAKRLEHIGCSKTVIGISGGLDSTLALLVIVETYKLLGISLNQIVTVTMPGFGTTDRTYQNAIALCKMLGTDLREIPIKDACELHFKAIGHDLEVHDVTYENVQARERTKILMNLANKEGGIVIGTGDLSEIALGWSTFNGDHMSMYAVNCSVPKTLITSLVEWVAEHRPLDKAPADFKKILLDVVSTPISPELLPPDEDGKIKQKTESTLGPYEVHDFFLYHTVKYGASSEKVCFLALQAFDGKYSPDEISRWQQLFIRRFFSQQFKRSCIPDGPKVGTISLSPRGDWRMPSDASANIWLG
jgi:NAD+ synthase (glutamine-hydrolysing)